MNRYLPDFTAWLWRAALRARRPQAAGLPNDAMRRARPAALLLLLGALWCAAGFTQEAKAQGTVFNTDIYIAVAPEVHDLDGQEVHAVYYQGGSVIVPKSTFAKGDVVTFDDKLQGADGLKKAIGDSMADANKEFAEAGVKFEIRNIYLVRGDNTHLKNSYRPDFSLFNLGVEDDKSALLEGFKRLTSGTTDAFKILMAPLDEGEETIEPGWAADNGNVSVMDIGRVTLTRDNGFIVIHELGHNLGLEHRAGADPFKVAMATQVPNRPPGQETRVATPELSDAEVSTIRRNVATDRYNGFKKTPKAAKTAGSGSGETSLAPQSHTPQSSSAQTALSIPASSTVPPGETSLPASFMPEAPVSLINISAGGFGGEIDRRPTGILGFEIGGHIARSNLTYVDNEADVDGYFASGSIDTTALDRQLWGDYFQIDPTTRIETGFHFMNTRSDVSHAFGRIAIEPGANLLIFSPQGLQGNLGGGLNAGPRDAVNVAYRNEFEQSEYNLTKTMSVQSGPVTLRPGLRLGYGETSVDEWYSGQVAGINEDFSYYNTADVESLILGASLGLELDLGRLGGIPVGYFGGISGAAYFNDQSGQSTLTLDGLVNAQETQILGGSETTGYFELESGLNFQLGRQVELSVGARYRHFKTPGIEIMPQETARITWQDADEITGFASVNVGFGGPPAGPNGGFYASDRRLKRDIEHVATLANGIRLYRFKYLWSEREHVGVMAQELLTARAFRLAVALTPEGFYAVNYARLGLQMASLADWRARGLDAVLTGTH